MTEAPPIRPDAARALVAAVRFFHARGWCPATSSNFSYRGDGCVWISQSGVDKGAFGPEHLMPVDLDGVPIPPEQRRPSAETGLHTLVYRNRPDAQAVLHVHGLRSVVFSRLLEEAGEVTFEGWELQKGLRGETTHESRVRIPIFSNRQDIPALAAEIEPVLKAKPGLQAFLLAGHGLYAFGRDVAEAKRHIEVVEALLEQTELWRKLS
ncbi:MAG: methylthioribulose 1-phosphate dehydratase [Myxococcota bacterium]